ncbi:hypothetical protein GCM10028868_26450 [Virgibacillus kimchii]
MLARKIRKSSLWRSLKATHRIVLIELLLQAQFKDGEVVRNGEIIFLKRGQIATSYQLLVDDIGDKDVTVKVVRNAINKLVKHGFLAKDEAKARAKKGLLLTVVNYDTYQTPDNYKGKDKDKETGNEGAKRGQSEGKARAINKNGINNDLNNGVNNEQQHTAAVTQFWDNNGFGYNNIQAKTQLLSWLDDSKFKNPSEVIIKAMEIACSNNKRRLNYVEGILKNWENESLLTIEEIEQAQNKGKPHLQVVGSAYDPNKDRF